MRGRHRPRRARAAATAALAWVVRSTEDLFVSLARLVAAYRRRRRLREPAGPPTPQHADERTARRVAEAQSGGVSSAESAARLARGENPGGLHHKRVLYESPERLRPDQDEPPERKVRIHGRERHLPAMRRG
jgi:hypothetical protein